MRGIIHDEELSLGVIGGYCEGIEHVFPLLRPQTRQVFIQQPVDGGFVKDNFLR
jgi:hypothetical protein